MLLVLPVGVEGVEVYRCTQPDGHVSFQQGPCGGQGKRLEVGQVQSPWQPLRRSEEQLYRAYRKRDARRLAVQRRAEQQARLQPQVEPATCYNKRHALKEVQARLRAGYGAEQGERLRRRRDYLEGYLRRYCP